jgi:perosamine synthetase
MAGWIGPGERVKEFAADLGLMFDRHCTVTNSGTSALLLSYLALNLLPRSTICCPDYGLPACHNAARLLGHRVQLIDVDPATCCMDPAALERYVCDGACDAVVFVDHNGYAGTALRDVRAICTARGVPLIEDSAVALGCPIAGRVGDLSILSFSVPKIITTGQGGAVLTERDDLARRLAQLIDQGGGGWRNDRMHVAVGGNFRMPDVLAALGIAQLRDLQSLLKRRWDLWSWYRRDMVPGNDVAPSGWMMTVRAEDDRKAARILEEVHAIGYDCRRLYRPVHHCTPFAADAALFPGAEEVYARLLYLPSSLNLQRTQVSEITAAVWRGRNQ